MKTIHIILFFLLLTSCTVKKKSSGLIKRPVRLSGGDGSSINKAVIIKYALSMKDIVRAENRFLKENIDYTNQWQILSKSYIVEYETEVVTVKLQTVDSVFSVYFDLQYYKGK